MQGWESEREYCPGFYISYNQSTHQHLVYAFDINEAIWATSEQIRPPEQIARVQYENDELMREIKEVYFLKQLRQKTPYPKFEVGDEVIVDGKPCNVLRSSFTSLTIVDPATEEVSKIDPQRAMPGKREHWKATHPGEFRTTNFTFTIGEFVYRPVQMLDTRPVNKIANGILSCISGMNGDTIQLTDAWDCKVHEQVSPNSIVKAPLQVRRALTHKTFHKLRDSIKKQGLDWDRKFYMIRNHPQFENLCFATHLKLKFTATDIMKSRNLE